jgi:hypothetical protein
VEDFFAGMDDSEISDLGAGEALDKGEVEEGNTDNESIRQPDASVSKRRQFKISGGKRTGLRKGRLSKEEIRECMMLGDMIQKQAEELALRLKRPLGTVMQEAGLLVKGVRAPSRWNKFQSWYADQKRREEKGGDRPSEEHEDSGTTDGNCTPLHG